MLVLGRNVDQKIVIGEGHDAIVIQVVDVRGNKVRLGIDAPRSVPVHRQEVYIEILREKCRSTE